MLPEVGSATKVIVEVYRHICKTYSVRDVWY